MNKCSFVASIVKLKVKISIIILILSFLIGGFYYLYTGRAHNPITEIAADIIEKETGIDLEKLIADDTISKATP